MTRSGISRLCSTVVSAALLACATRGVAEPGRVQGANTGDGSTPFTGLAQAPEANLFVGSATTSIPIDVPPGRKNLTPKLALTYTSSGGPSPYGYGWDLPLGKVQRCTKHGVLSCTDPTYRNDFVLALPTANVECTLEPGAQSGMRTCHPSVEESFVRISYFSSNNRWEAWDKSGLHYVFGDTFGTRVGSSDSLFNPATPCSYTFAWALTRIEDPNGNYLDVTYLDDQGVLYPDALRYGGNRLTGLAPQFEVHFVWSAEDGFSRPPGDQIVTSSGGYPATLTRLLSRIEVRYPVGGARVRSYLLQYEFQLAAWRAGRQSFLTAVTLLDGSDHALARADGAPTSTTFLYHTNTPESGRFGFDSGQLMTALNIGAPTILRYTSPHGDLRDTTREVLDMNGDGIADLVEVAACSSSAAWSVYLGTARGFQPSPIPWRVPDAGVMCRVRQVKWLNDDGDHETWMDTLDINGDGVPDFVDARTTPWRVALGRVAAAGAAGGFDPPVPWTAPLAHLRFTYGNTNVSINTTTGNTWHWENGFLDRLDLIDLNGDGRLDLVQTPPRGQLGAWTVWFNQGTGFETIGMPFDTPFPFLRYAGDHGTQEIGLYDINGDGLPDQILGVSPAPNSWWVYLNSGRGIEHGGRTWNAPDQCGHTGIQDSVTHAGVARDFFDINGDGLPDLVTACLPTWKVQLNRGADFSAALDWQSPSVLIRVSDESTTYADTFDADGDGMVDFVDLYLGLLYHNRGGAWAALCDQGICPEGANAVVPNIDGARPDLLEQMENGIGSVTSLDYRPSSVWDNTDASHVPRLPFVLWTLTHLEQDDGLCNGDLCLSEGAHELQKELRYAYGRFDAAAREFRGFGTVQQLDADGNPRTAFFHQDPARKGKMASEYLHAAGVDANAAVPLVWTVNTWECASSPPNSFATTCPGTLAGSGPLWVRLREIDRYDYFADAPTAKHAWTRNEAWDAYGNITVTAKGGDGTTKVYTFTEYAANPQAYIVDRIVHSSIKDSAWREEKWFLYDGLPLGQVDKGNLTTLSSWLNRVLVPGAPLGDPCPAGSGTCVSTTLTYDSYGNVTRVVDADGHPTTTTYEGTQIHPATVTNALGHVVSTAYDPGCGVLVSQTEPTGAVTLHQYDSFCRLKKTALPGETLAAPHRQYRYFLGAPGQPTDLLTIALEPSSAVGVVLRNDLFDALGGRVQTQRDAVIDGAARTVVDGTVSRDARGNVRSRCTAFAVPRVINLPTRGVPYQPLTGDVGCTSIDYDPLSRVTRTTAPDGAVSTTDYSVPWRATTFDVCYHAGTCPGGKTVEMRDAFGRAKETQRFNGDTFESRTVRTYDGLGRLLTSTQGTTPASRNRRTKITITYDTLGRKIQMVDPDSGKWRYAYDRVGNLMYQDDPKRGQHLQFTYDALNRVTAKYALTSASAEYCDLHPASSCTATRTDLVTFRYDEPGSVFGCPTSVCTLATCALGHLTSVSEERTRGSTQLCYDVRGRRGRTTTGITALGRTIFASTTYEYDATDHLTRLTYPDGELVTYEYDDVGQIESVRGSAPDGRPQVYLANLAYDVFGRPHQITHGNGVADVWSYGGVLEHFHLTQIRSQAPSAPPIQALSYDGYQRNGLLGHITDYGLGGALNDTARFAYDSLGRLIDVGESSIINPGNIHPLYEYSDHLGNLTKRDGQSFVYNWRHPHQLVSASGGAVTHDANGNRSSKQNGAQLYAYTPDDRLEHVTANQQTVEFQYDYSGRRVAKIVGNSVTRYYSDLAEASGPWLTKYYRAGSLLIASQRVAVPATLAGLSSDPWVQLSQVSGARPLLLVRLREDLCLPVVLSAALIGPLLILAPWRRRRVRYGHVGGAVILLSVASLPVPMVIRPASAAALLDSTAGAGSAGVMHYHLDHLGSVRAITRSDGSVLEYVRYSPYGEPRGHFDRNGQPQANDCSADDYCLEFTGYDTEPQSGLQYAGARFYDPALGAFLTRDPARQFASPYTYTNWNPVNYTDPNGEFIAELITAMVIAAAVSAAVSTVVAAAQGASLGQIGQAAAMGAASGAVGVGLGVVASGVNVGLASLAGTLPENVGLQEALNGLGEVAYRSAFSTVVANAAGRTAAAAGAPEGAVVGLSMVAGYGASYVYDSNFIDYNGDLAQIEDKGTFQNVSNTVTHTDVTRGGAEGAGFSTADANQMLAANLAQDNDLWHNQNHFDFGAQSAFEEFSHNARDAFQTGGPRSEAFLTAVGQASHHLQDQYALGHVFPGTSLLRNRWGAIPRALVHQTIGGEVTFIDASRRASLDFFRGMHSLAEL